MGWNERTRDHSEPFGHQEARGRVPGGGGGGGVQQTETTVNRLIGEP